MILAIRADITKIIKLTEKKIIIIISQTRLQARNKQVWIIFTNITESEKIHNDCF